MAFDLNSIKVRTDLRAPRILLIGVEKIGKTCFACGCHFDENGKMAEQGLNNPVVIPVKGEEGIDGLEVPSFPTVQTFGNLLECTGALYEENDYGFVVYDSASSIQPLIVQDVCEEFNVNNVRKVPGFRTGEAAVEVRWRNFLNGIDGLRNNHNKGCVMICHTRIKKHKNPEGDDYDKYDVDLENDAAEMLKRWADVILFCNSKVTVKVDGKDGNFSTAKRTGKDITGGKRFLYTQHRPAHPGGGRGVYGMLPYELPLDWVAFQDAVAAVVT